MLAPYCEDKVWENSHSPYCCDLSLTPFTSSIVHFGLGMQHATTFIEIGVFVVIVASGKRAVFSLNIFWSLRS